jgi:hypothetical protein
MLEAGTVQPDLICMRVVSLKMASTATGFIVFNFSFEYLKRLQSSEPLHSKMPPILLLIRHAGCMGTNHNLFRQTVFQKCGRVYNFSLDYRIVSRMFGEYQQPAIQTSTVARKVQVTAWIQYSAI